MGPDFFGLLVVFAVGTLVLWRFKNADRVARAREEARDDDGEVTILAAGASSMFLPRFERHVAKDSVVYLPAGDGLYPGASDESGAREYRAVLQGWLKRGARIKVFLTEDTIECRKRWSGLIQKHGDNVELFYLDASRIEVGADPRIAHEIAALSTFHPVLLVSESGKSAPGAMWIEGYHPLHSRNAFNVRYIPPSAIEGSNRAKFDEYLDMYARLERGGHAVRLSLNLPEDHRASPAFKAAA